MKKYSDDYQRLNRDRFRGSEEKIRKRLESYSGVLKSTAEHFCNGTAIDLGCGRGEMLQQLALYFPKIIGIDSDSECIAECEAKKLSVIKGDIFQELRKIADASVSVITAIHIIEHLNKLEIEILIREINRVLAPGGIVIIETPNPENLYVSTNTFWLDRTHIAPIPHVFLEAALSVSQSLEVKIIRLPNDGICAVPRNNLFSGLIMSAVSMDYAAIGVKHNLDGSVENDLTKPLEQMRSSSGLSLHQVLAEVDNAFIRLETKTEEVTKVIKSLDFLLRETTESRNALINSTSWRITKPVRLIGKLFGVAKNNFKKKEEEKYTNTQSNRKRCLYIDVTSIQICGDIGTGIQRVVNYVAAFMLRSVRSYSVYCVYYDRISKTYYRSHDFEERVSGISSRKNSVAVHITPEKDDIFLGLDYCAEDVVSNKLRFKAYKENGVRTVFVVYDLLPITSPQFFPPHMRNSHHNWLHEVTKAELCLCISRTSAARLKEWIPSHAPESQTKVAWFNLAQTVNDLQKNAYTSRSRDNDTFSFLMVGTIEPRKGYKYIYDYFLNAWQGGLSHRLIIVGRPGWHMDDFIERTRNCNFSGTNLIIDIDCHDDALREYYQMSDVLIAASYDEGFGLPLIEAASKGLSIIARDTQIHRELLGDDAYYFSEAFNLSLDHAISSWISDYRKSIEKTLPPSKIITPEQSIDSFLDAIEVGLSVELRSRRP
jgi:glycosyltransferase involved in cell wall biosynthesis/ubiquinone/menaquinone biosynthesis C-methylase UbiE